MLSDSINLVSGSVITNVHIESGNAFPTADKGRMFYLNAAVGANSPGLYVYDGTVWVTGDVTNLSVDSNMTGGGSGGDISIGINTNVIATVSLLNTTKTTLQNSIDTKMNDTQTFTLTGDVTASGNKTAVATLKDSGVLPGSYTKTTVNSKGIVVGGASLTSSDVTTALTYTPVNAAAVGAANGVAALDSSGHLPIGQLTTSVPIINPAAPKDGDVQVAAGPTISIYATGAWRQIYPAVYS